MEKDEFKLFLEEKRSWYKKVGKVFCPVLNEWVVFNSQGFRHLRYDGNGKPRTNKQQIYRMNVLVSVTEVIQDSYNVLDKQVRYLGTKEVKVEYWELGKIIQNDHVTVILRRSGNGSVAFYSIWKKPRKSKNPPREIL